MRISGPKSRNRRSGQYTGNWTAAASGPLAATTLSKYARSAVTTAVHSGVAAALLGALTGPAAAWLGAVAT